MITTIAMIIPANIKRSAANNKGEAYGKPNLTMANDEPIKKVVTTNKAIN